MRLAALLCAALAAALPAAAQQLYYRSNDAGMLRAAGLGICVLSPEGTAGEAAQAADVLTPDIAAALALLHNPRRLVATLRR